MFLQILSGWRRSLAVTRREEGAPSLPQTILPVEFSDLLAVRAGFYGGGGLEPWPCLWEPKDAHVGGFAISW